MLLISGLSSFSGTTLYGITMAKGLPTPAAIGALAIVGSVLLMWVGIRRFCGLSAGWTVAGIILAAMATLIALSGNSSDGRDTALFAGQLITHCLIAFDLFRHNRRGFGSGLAASGAIANIIANSLTLGFSLLYVFGSVSASTKAMVRTDSMLLVALGAILTIFGIALMAIDRLLLELEDRAGHDELTGLPNRRQFVEQLDRAKTQSRLRGTDFSILLIDIDHFKQWNDGFGHLTGDMALKHFARIASKALAPDDLLARTGGDEFCVLMPGSSLDKAAKLAEQLVRSMGETPLCLESGAVTLTISIGIAASNRLARKQKEDPLALADIALYSAKKDGRNRFCVYSPDLDAAFGRQV
ncbi:GGDEF domain-containing protein [Martelella sp. HB161492]|uniref:GGDEF domain-containing protein n=1 Tax=Martelella sp. HB161492 TaxID=2720726 RepID=UPI00159086AB|nr:GGDEF domain-containing protein [Martelella sp. HB161492]